MRDDETIGGDKYFHCKANFEATRRGKLAEIMATILSDLRETSNAQSNQSRKGLTEQQSIFILKIFYKIVLYGFALIGFAFVVTMAFFYFDSAGNYCLDAGGVWDEDQKICRYDCDKWEKGKDCIVFDKTDDKEPKK